MQKARRLVVWMDSSVRWTSGYKHVFERAERYGSQISRWEGRARVTAHTLRPVSCVLYIGHSNIYGVLYAAHRLLNDSDKYSDD